MRRDYVVHDLPLPSAALVEFYQNLTSLVVLPEAQVPAEALPSATPPPSVPFEPGASAPLVRSRSPSPETRQV